MTVMRVGIATDHGGFALKEELVAQLRAAGHEVVDFGAHSLQVDDDYPDFVVPLAKAVVAANVDRGVAICGSGVGASVCANKIRGTTTPKGTNARSCHQPLRFVSCIRLAPTAISGSRVTSENSA